MVSGCGLLLLQPRRMTQRNRSTSLHLRCRIAALRIQLVDDFHFQGLPHLFYTFSPPGILSPFRPNLFWSS